MKRKIVAVIENHFDPIWRRRFHGDIVHDGKNYVSYEKIEQYYIEENIRLAREIPDYKFQIENPCVIENYLRRFPEKKAVLKKLYRDGVLKTSNTGYTIMESNMVSFEALVRNYLASDAFFLEYVGKTPALANRSDAFGNSAQLPQLLKAFGATYLIEVYYNTVTDEDGWKGLDGSVICVKKHSVLGGCGGWGKYAPCPACSGFGCEECGGRGIDTEKARKEWRDFYIRPEKQESGVIRVGGEEFLPRPETAEQVKRAAEEHNVDISLGHWDFLLKVFSKEIAQIEAGDTEGLKLHGPEYNPNTTGGYVTHIDVKQDLAETEHLLLTGETLEALGMLQGKQPYSYGEIWKNFLLCGFHDASSTTLVDAAYREVKQLFGEIRAFTQERYQGNGCYFNATSHPFNGLLEREGKVARLQLPPYSCGTARFEAPGEIIQGAELPKDLVQESVLTGKTADLVAESGEVFYIENEFFYIEADQNGLRSITDKRYGPVLESLGETRPLDFLWESDVGSPWATLEPPYRQELMHSFCSFLRKEQGDGFVRLCFVVKIPFNYANVVGKNRIEWSVMLADGYDRVRFHVEADWCTAAKRLRVCFPIPLQGKDIYGIPGGWLERQPYEPDYSWNGANGDWPAFRYGGIDTEARSVAVFNRGTPSYKILPQGKGKILYISVLRSPVLPVCLHEATAYSRVDYDGLRDEGHHVFDFEVASYGSKLCESAVHAEAEQFSRPPVAVAEAVKGELPYVTEGSASVTHVKPAEDGDGIIVRITEHGGKGGKIKLFLPQWVQSVRRSDLPERKSEAMLGDTLVLRPFEIATLRITRV